MKRNNGMTNGLLLGAEMMQSFVWEERVTGMICLLSV